MKIIECPRDAMQGLDKFISTEDKVRYINCLLKAGFDTIDFGSFVSPKIIPQMKDTVDVLNRLDISESRSKLLAIVANTRGAKEASGFESITCLGFPLSISETFQRRNTNKSIIQALNAIEEIKNICVSSGKQLVVYISMGFGNPYGDPYHPDLVGSFVDILITLGSDVISLADTVGMADADEIRTLFTTLTKSYPDKELGVHLHSTPEASIEKIRAAYRSGCRRFDGAIKGFGGCPMAKDDLVGNIPTEQIISFAESEGLITGIDPLEFRAAFKIAEQIFPLY